MAGRPACVHVHVTSPARPSACPSVLDKDLTDADDALGIAEIRLEGDSGEQTLTLKGVGESCMHACTHACCGTFDLFACNGRTRCVDDGVVLLTWLPCVRP